jgi:hypothetical protein
MKTRVPVDVIRSTSHDVNHAKKKVKPDGIDLRLPAGHQFAAPSVWTRDFDRARQPRRSMPLSHDKPEEDDQGACQNQRRPAPPLGERRRRSRGWQCYLAIVLYDGHDLIVEMSHALLADLRL